MIHQYGNGRRYLLPPYQHSIRWRPAFNIGHLISLLLAIRSSQYRCTTIIDKNTPKDGTFASSRIISAPTDTISKHL